MSLQDQINDITVALQSKTSLTNLVPGTKMYQIAESVVYQNLDVQKQFDKYAEDNSIATATGTALDKIGENVFGIYRLPEVKPFITESMFTLKFYVSLGTFGDINRDAQNQPQPIILPEGTLVVGSYGGASYKFRVTREYELGVNASEQYVSAELVQGSTTTIPANVLTYHDFTDYTQEQSKMLLVTNPVGVSTGRALESDDSYRYRISRAIRAFPRSTYYGVYDLATSIPGVSDVTIVQSSSGGGTFTVYVQGTTPITAAEVIADVKLKLEASLPPWATFTVAPPFYIGLSLVLNVNSQDNSEYIRSLIIDNVSTYINNYVGDVFYLNRILHIANMAHASINTVTFDSYSTFAGESMYRELVDLTYGSDSEPMFNLRAIDKLIVEPMVNAIQVNFTV